VFKKQLVIRQKFLPQTNLLNHLEVSNLILRVITEAVHVNHVEPTPGVYQVQRG